MLAGILPYQWIKNSSSANGVNEWYTETIILRSLTALGNVSLGEFALVNISMDTPIATSDLSIRNQKYLYIENRNGTILFKSSGSIFTTSQNNFTIDTSSFFHLRKNLSVPGDVYYDVPQDVQVVLWFTNYTSSAINITYRFSDSPQFKTAIIPSLTPSSPQTMSFAVYPIDFSFNGLTKGTAASDPRSFILNSHQYGWKPILDRASGGAFVSKGLLSPGDALDVFPWIINSITPTACKPTDNQYTIWDYQSQIVSDYETLYNLNFASELSYSNYDAVLLMFPENCQTDRPGEAGQAYVRGQLDVQDGGTIGLTSMVPVSSVGIKNATNLEYSWIVLHEMYGHAAFGFMHTSVMICLSKTDFSSCNSSISFDGEYYMVSIRRKKRDHPFIHKTLEIF